MGPFLDDVRECCDNRGKKRDLRFLALKMGREVMNQARQVASRSKEKGSLECPPGVDTTLSAP